MNQEERNPKYWYEKEFYYLDCKDFEYYLFHF